jgi:hypothetical protein
MCNRHAESLWQKSRTHRVYQQRVGYLVVSGESGDEYGVVECGGQFACTCDWQKYNPTSECSHTLAVREYEARQEGRTIRAYDNGSRFERAHQRFEGYNDGVIVASRVN